jgi:hypothetical protein
MTAVGGDAAAYCDPENPKAAAAVVDAVLREPDTERRTRVSEGLARAARFSSRAMARAYLSVYHEAVTRLGLEYRRQGADVEILTLDRPDAEWIKTFPLPCHALGPAFLKYSYSRRLVPWLQTHTSTSSS